MYKLLGRVAVVCLLFATAISASAAPKIIESVEGRVIGVLDGDTFDVLTSSRTTVRVRIAAIDAPESSQPWGNRSKQALSEMIFGRQVLVHVYKLDRHESKHGKRRIGHVYAKDRDVGLDMVAAGMAWHNTPFQREQSAGQYEAYSGAELSARNAKRGLWSDPQPVAPWKFRRGDAQ